MEKTSQLSNAQIQQALKAGIISPSQAKAMRRANDEKAEQSQTPSQRRSENKSMIGNEEDLRFLRSFSDVFIAIGLFILGLGAIGFVRILGGGIWNLVIAGLIFVMALYFGRKKRAHLPTLILSLAFLFFIQAGTDAILSTAGISAAAITLIAMSGFYAVIRLPFCIALIAIAALYLLFSVLRAIAPELLINATGMILILSGIIIFIIALIYDRFDQHRTTRFSDNAFWLHLLAAPLIIHGLAIGAIQQRIEKLFGVIPIIEISQIEAVIILAMVGLMTLIGLAINRRALIVSSLGYAAFALVYLINGTGLGFGSVIVATLIALGLFIVLLGVIWHDVRNVIIKFLPKWRVFPPPYDPSFRH